MDLILGCPWCAGENETSALELAAAEMAQSAAELVSIERSIMEAVRDKVEEKQVSSVQ
jgi:hypothetical protein